MPYTRVWIHFVWATKSRRPLLQKAIRQTVFNHIVENSKKKGIHINVINGYLDHVHALISLSNDQTITKIMQLLKGESSYWINKNSLTPSAFEWQDDYFAVSVGESALEEVRRYIRNQEEHHRKKGFAEEYDEFMHQSGGGLKSL